MLAKLSPEKNHEMLLLAARILVDKGIDIRVLLAGEGPTRDALASRIRELGLRETVEISGYVDRDTFFAGIDMLVLCSTLENLPFSLMEAMSRGLPVVATSVGGVPDLVEDGVTGYLVPPGQVDMLSQRLQALVRDDALRDCLGAAGRRKLEAEFALERCVASHIELYRSM